MSGELVICYVFPGAEVPKIYILDARSYSAAFANRAKGGGFESPGEFVFFVFLLVNLF